MRRLLAYYGLAACCAVAVVAATRIDLTGMVPARKAEKPVVAAGTVTAAGLPLAGVRMFFHTAGIQVADATTRRDGGFEAGLDGPGDYIVIIGTSDTLWSTYREVTLSPGANVVDVDLPPTTVDVAFTADGLKNGDVVQVAVLGPTAPTKADTVSFFTWRAGARVRFVGIGFGAYVLTAFTGSDATKRLTAETPATFVLTPDRPTANVDLRLIDRRLALEVLDPNGSPIDYADALALRQRLERDSAGHFDLSHVPAGVPLLVSASGWLPACVITEANGRQVVTLQPRGPNRLVLNLLGGPGRPVGDLDGLPGTGCPVPVAALDVDLASATAADRLTIAGLPEGAFRYRADALAPAMGVVVP